jgi:hypothetical protein
MQLMDKIHKKFPSPATVSVDNPANDHSYALNHDFTDHSDYQHRNLFS